MIFRNAFHRTLKIRSQSRELAQLIKLKQENQPLRFHLIRFILSVISCLYSLF